MASGARGALMSTRTVVDGVPIHALAAQHATERPVVVLVHGLLLSSRYMVPLAERLAEEFEVWAPDMPGFGRSGDPPDVPDVRGLGRWLRRWIDARGLTDVTLVANSFGCQYAVDLVAHDPSQIRRVVLTGPTMDPARRTALRQAARWTANASREPLSLGLVMLRDLMDCTPWRVGVTFRHGLLDAIETKLPRVGVRTIVVRGERDLLVTQRWAEKATALLPSGRRELDARARRELSGVQSVPSRLPFLARYAADRVMATRWLSGCAHRTIPQS
jgi:2-hydroxy-6-oxonona-2,4-dienedioate hydrolase